MLCDARPEFNGVIHRIFAWIFNGFQSAFCFVFAIIVVIFMAFIIHFYSMFSSRGSNSLFHTTTPYSFILYGDNPWHSFPQSTPFILREVLGVLGLLTRPRDLYIELFSFDGRGRVLALASRDPHVTHRSPNFYSSLSSFLVIYTATLTHQQNRFRRGQFGMTCIVSKDELSQTIVSILYQFDETI